MASRSLSPIIAAGTSNANGATTTGATIALGTSISATITGIITNGATGPTTQAVAYIEVSGDGTIWKRLPVQFPGGIVAGTVTPFMYTLPKDFANHRVVVTGNTGQAVTCEAFSHIFVSA